MQKTLSFSIVYPKKGLIYFQYFTAGKNNGKPSTVG